MEIFGIGAPEILLIMVVALIVFGPEKLPEIAGKAGKMVRQFRQMTSEATSEIRSLTNEIGLDDKLKESLQEFKNISSVVTEEVSSITNSVNGTITEQYQVSYQNTAPESEAPGVSPANPASNIAENGEALVSSNGNPDLSYSGDLPDFSGVNQTLVDNVVESSPLTSVTVTETVTYLDPALAGPQQDEPAYQIVAASSNVTFNGTSSKPRISKRSANGSARQRNRE